MSLGRLAWRGLTFHRRRHGAVALGLGVASAVLTGALVVGDSVRASLRAIARVRLGEVEYAVDGGAHRVRPAVAAALESALEADVAPVLRLAGSATNGDGALSVGRVQVLGVDARFWRLGPSAAPEQISEDAVVINRRLAGLLSSRPGDELVLRLPEEHSLSGELPFSWSRPASRPARLVVDAIATDEHLGRFSPAVSQLSPATIFLPRARLAGLLGREDRANLFLLSARAGSGLSVERIAQALRETLELSDVGLTLTPTAADGQLLSSDQYFLPRPVSRAVSDIQPAPAGVLTYLVNRIASTRLLRRGRRGTIGAARRARRRDRSRRLDRARPASRRR